MVGQQETVLNSRRSGGIPPVVSGPLLIRTRKRPGVLSELANVRNIESEEKIKNFDNAVEVLLLKALFLQTLKIISNCYWPAFLCEVLVNYASNMIRIR